MDNGSQQIELSPIKQIELLASKIPEVVSLAQGIPADDTPDLIKSEAIKALQLGQTARYSLTYGLPRLREAISEHLQTMGMEYDWEREIIITAGSIEGITATLLALVNPGDEVIITSPSYASYQQAIKVARAVPIEVDLDEKWQFDLEVFKQRITKKTKAVIIANPNNPTGTIFAKDQLIEIGKLAKTNNFFIILDEVYRDLVYEGGSLFSLAELPEFRDVVIRVYSFSKAYAMTGWRIGYLHSDKRNVDEIIKTHDALVTCAPVISQYAALAALLMPTEQKNQIKDAYQSRREAIVARLDKMQDIFSYQKPTAAYFVFPKIKLPEWQDSWRLALALLEQAKVAVVPGVSFGQRGEGHIRMCFGRSIADINLAFDRMEKFFAKINQ